MSQAHNNPQRQQAWSKYWASGRLHSCVGSFPDNYAGAIGDFWRGLFAKTGPASRILDLGTGNGPLPLLLWDMQGDGVEIDAVDMAALAPAWYRPDTHRTITFHARTSMEELPFPAASFDWVVSQFGMEYADRQGVLAEIARVARPQAVLAFVMHHADSVLVKVAREELRHYAFLLSEGGLLDSARAIAPWIARARLGQDLGKTGAASEARALYNEAMRGLAHASEKSAAPDLLLEARDVVHGLLAEVAAGDAAQVSASLDAYALDLEGARLRTAELVSHALDQAQLEEMKAWLARSMPEISIQVAELVQSEGVLAWSLVANPPDDVRHASGSSASAQTGS